MGKYIRSKNTYGHPHIKWILAKLEPSKYYQPVSSPDSKQGIYFLKIMIFPINPRLHSGVFPHCGPNVAFKAHLWSHSSNLSWMNLLNIIHMFLRTKSLIHQAKAGFNSQGWSLNNVNTSFIFNLTIQHAVPFQSLQLPSSRRSQLVHDKQMLPDVPCFFPLCSWISSLRHISTMFLFFKERASLFERLSKGPKKKHSS